MLRADLRVCGRTALEVGDHRLLGAAGVRAGPVPAEASGGHDQRERGLPARLRGVDRGQRPPRRGLLAGPRGRGARRLHPRGGAEPPPTGSASRRTRRRSAARTSSRTAWSVINPFGEPCVPAGAAQVGRRRWRSGTTRGAPSLVSEDGTTALTVITTNSDDSEVIMDNVDFLRETVPDADGEGNELRAYVTGTAGLHRRLDRGLRVHRRDPAAGHRDLVLVLLLLLYRSPVIALVPLITVGIAYTIAAAAVYGLVEAGAVDVNGQTTCDPDRAHVRRGHGLLPADRRQVPGGACASTGTSTRRWREATERTAPAILSAGGDGRRLDAGADPGRLQGHADDGPGARARRRDHARSRG